MMPSTPTPKSCPTCLHPYPYYPPQSSIWNSSPSHYHPYWTLSIDNFFAIIKQKDQQPVIFTTINNDTIACQQLLFIHHMNNSITKLKETISNLQNKVDWQKTVAQGKLDDFLTQNILVEHGFRVPNLTPSASSESSLDTMPIPSPSPNPSIYETANEFLDQTFPAMALSICRNPILVSNDEDWFSESMI